MLCPQPWTKMPPPPWELSVMPKPSMLDGLHWKLLGKGLFARLVPQLAAVSSVVPVGKPANRVVSTGFHISRSSLCDEAEWMAPAVVHAVATPAAVVQVGSIMIRSPGDAASIAAWTEAVGATCVGALPPIVTVTVSIDCLPLAAVMT